MAPRIRILSRYSMARRDSMTGSMLISVKSAPERIPLDSPVAAALEGNRAAAAVLEGRRAAAALRSTPREAAALEGNRAAAAVLEGRRAAAESKTWKRLAPLPPIHLRR